jgi:hypothetical protein
LQASFATNSPTKFPTLSTTFELLNSCKMTYFFFPTNLLPNSNLCDFSINLSCLYSSQICHFSLQICYPILQTLLLSLQI